MEDLASSGLTRVLVAAVRVLVALLWSENLSWKRPPEFGNQSSPPQGLYQWTLYGVQNEVFGPWAWFVDNVVLPKKSGSCGPSWTGWGSPASTRSSAHSHTAAPPPTALS